MKIVVNGREREVPEGSTLAELLRRLEVDRRTVAVEHNRNVVKRSELDGVDLGEGDRVEVVQFVGGG